MRTHLDRLVALEYVLVHRGGRGQSFVYEALWDGAGTDGRPHLVGLVEVATLAEAPGAVATTADHEGPDPGFEPPTRAQRGPVEGGPRPPGNGAGAGRSPSLGDRVAQNAHQGNGSGSHVVVGGSR